MKVKFSEYAGNLFEKILEGDVCNLFAKIIAVEFVNVLNLHIIDLARKYYTHLQREIEKEEER
jgi:hypothetical protein